MANPTRFLVERLDRLVKASSGFSETNRDSALIWILLKGLKMSEADVFQELERMGLDDARILVGFRTLLKTMPNVIRVCSSAGWDDSRILKALKARGHSHPVIIEFCLASGWSLGKIKNACSPFDGTLASLISRMEAKKVAILELAQRVFNTHRQG